MKKISWRGAEISFLFFKTKVLLFMHSLPLKVIYLPILSCIGFVLVLQGFAWVKRALLILLNIKINLNINISFLTWKYASMAKWVRAVLIIILLSICNNIIIYIHGQSPGTENDGKKMNCQSSVEHSLYFLWQGLSKHYKTSIKLVLEKWLKKCCIFIGESGISCDFYSRT